MKVKEGKKSLLVSIKIKNQIYGLTKIEPSFDGWRDVVSQTKGIIFYFQEYSENKKLRNNFKETISRYSLEDYQQSPL